MPDLGVRAAEENFADRRLAGKNVLGERFVDDANARRALAVLRGERAAFAKRDAQQPEIILADDLQSAERALGHRQDRPPGDTVRRAQAKANQRQADGNGRVAHGRIGAQALGDPAEKVGPFGTRLVMGGGNGDERGRDAVRIKARRRALQPQKTQQAAMRRRSTRSYDGQRDLADDERRTRKLAPPRAPDEPREPSFSTSMSWRFEARKARPGPVRRAMLLTKVTPGGERQRGASRARSVVFGGNCDAHQGVRSRRDSLARAARPAPRPRRRKRGFRAGTAARPGRAWRRAIGGAQFLCGGKRAARETGWRHSRTR